MLLVWHFEILGSFGIGSVINAALRFPQLLHRIGQRKSFAKSAISIVCSEWRYLISHGVQVQCSHMDFSVPAPGEKLGSERLAFLNAFKKSCRRSIIGMVKNSQSGHPGGSLSALDMLATLYAFRLSVTGEKIVVSNGHISLACIQF